MNQIFGYQLLPEEISSNDIVFDGTQPVLPNGKHGQVKICAHPQSHLQSYFSQEHGAYSYVWGIPVHPEVATPDIPEWCIKVVDEKRYERFKELIGTFVIVIDEPKQNRITFVTDILGIRPMFLGNYNDRIVFGSDVWVMQKAGVSKGAINYDAVSSWIAYGYNCTNGSFFDDLRRLPPGSAVVYQDGQCNQVPYAEFKGGTSSLSTEQVAKDLHDTVSTTFKTLLSKYPHVSIALSGGYDSRYSLALSASLGKILLSA